MKKIFIVSANFKKAYPIVKSTKKNGYTTIGGYYQNRSPVFSRYLDKRYKIFNPYLSEKKYIIDILSIVKKENPIMIIPVGYIDVVVISKYRKILPEDIIIPVPSYRDIIKVSDKKTVKKLIKSLNIKTPTEYNINSLNEIKNIRLPVVIKRRFDNSNPIYVFNRIILEKYIRKNMKLQDLLIEEFIPGPGHGYFAISYKGDVKIEFAHIRKIEKNPSGGPSILACSYLDPKLIKIGRSIIKELNWTGMIMVEFKRDIETGQYFFIEINPKFWGSLELAVRCGYDFPGILISTFLKKKYDRKLKVHENCCFTWILDGIHYLTKNYRVWLYMLKSITKKGHYTDIHLSDPSEFLYSFSTRFYNIVVKKRNVKIEKYFDSKKSFLMYILSRNPKFIIFDLDGTIVNLNIDWNKIRERLIREGLISKYSYIMESLLYYKNHNLDIYNYINGILTSYELNAIKNTKINPYFIENLRILKNKYDKKIALVSKQSEEVLHNFVNYHGIKELFDIIIGREFSLKRYDQLYEVIRRLSLNPREGLVVGDSVNDMVAAARNDLFPVAITESAYKAQMFLELGIIPYKNVNFLISDLLKIWEKRYENNSYT